MKLTIALKEKIAFEAVRDLFAESLLKQFSDVQAKIENLVKDSYSDFDYENVGPYKEYIEWRTEIGLDHIPGEWSIHWDKFRRLLTLPGIERFSLSFEIPVKGVYTAYLEGKYEKKAMEALRPYMTNYLAAKEAYEEIQQALLGVNTHKQLGDSLPELVKYLPNVTNRAVTALVPIEQVNRVRNLFKRKEVA